MREIELKFAVHPSFHLEDVRGRAGIRSVEALEPLDLTSTYYDTRDLRLARSGVTLRFRTGDEQPLWTLKLPSNGSDAAVRDELNFAGNPEEIPSEAADLVVGQTRGAALEPVAVLTTKRERWRLLGTDDRELALVYEDDVSVVEQGRMLTRFREIELEGLSIGLRRLRLLGDALRDAGAVPTEPVSKALRALGPRATAPPDLPTPFELGPKAPASAAVQSMIVDAVDRITSHHAGARLGDEEGVHQMRVGTRRLRSNLRTFASLIDEPWATSVGPELTWLADVLGKVRDIDVLRERLEAASGDLRGDLETLFVILDAELMEHRALLYETLRSGRYRDLLETLVRAAQNPPSSPEASRRCDEVLVPHVVTTWARLRKAVRAAGKDSSADVLHRIRIRAKRARYGAEAVAPALGVKGAKATTFAKCSASLQEVLGEHQDAIVAQERLQKIASTHRGKPGFALAVGRLVEREHIAAERARGRWRKAWRELRHSKNTRWLKA